MEKLLLLLLITPVIGLGQITFTKNGNDDASLPENQDRISGTVWLTRGNQYGIYNAFDQNSARNQTTSRIKLALGSTENLSTLNFESISRWGKKFNEIDGIWFNENLVLQLTDTNEYYDFTMTSWENNGSFSYTRSSTALSLKDYTNTISIYPNPTTSIVTLQGGKQYDIKVYDMAGNKVMALSGNTIDMSHLSSATYIVKAFDKVYNQEVSYKVVKK
ncbi:MAG: hypothetical protein CMC82_06365 [Flavobacteriaceae bacterium]|nr:hypothetical protein [Flavobacteriaceae bacterium]|tara:strand:- start:162 stop:815 length:654 start_codon:yes stop_codon:yes gene_type:complete